MKYTKLGNTEINISKLCVGAMSFGQAGTMHDWTLDPTQSEAVIKQALDLGINFFSILPTSIQLGPVKNTLVPQSND